MTHYKAYIKNISQNNWLKDEKNGKVEHTTIEKEKLIFYDETDAESTLEYLNMDFEDCYVLLTDNA